MVGGPPQHDVTCARSSPPAVLEAAFPRLISELWVVLTPGLVSTNQLFFFLLLQEQEGRGGGWKQDVLISGLPNVSCPAV